MDDFLKHPKVQYIPLSINNYQEGLWQNQFHDNPEFYICQNRDDLEARLSHFQLPEISPTAEDMNNHMVIITLNFKVERGYFRFLTAKFIGEKKVGHFQVFYVTKKYFTKRVLHFTLYTKEGKKITWENVEII